jgi:hypothetical protein
LTSSLAELTMLIGGEKKVIHRKQGFGVISVKYEIGKLLEAGQNIK